MMAETMEAIEEVERMKTNLNIGKTYTDVDKMIEDLLADDVTTIGSNSLSED